MLSLDRLRELLTINQQNEFDAARIYFGYQGAVELLHALIAEAEKNEAAAPTEDDIEEFVAPEE